jgi:serine phosphatase RsbU (regulator of sigma subunit)
MEETPISPKKYRKLRKRAKKLRRRLEEAQERYESLQGMMQMTATHLHSIQAQLEKSNRSMTDSLYYARRIQRALLDTDEHIGAVFPQHFLFYRPKDILSGDVYWFSHQRGMDFAAVIDCTGHGVPAALLTVLAISLLNQTVSVFGIIDPAEILAQLDVMLAHYTRNEEKEAQVKDGMDMVICRYDHDTRELVVAGAHRPAYLMRGGELTEVKGAKYALGANSDRSNLLRNHVLQVLPGDMLYLFTDGYPDQFGGIEQRKFMMGQFKKMLAGLSGLPIAEQRQRLEGAFDEWKGKLPQTDDVLVAGIRF